MIVEVYESPTIGYELECVREDGTNHWLRTFHPEDADLNIPVLTMIEIPQADRPQS